MSRRWAHQEAAFQFVRGLYESNRRGAMLAMAMGTGKSKTAIDLADELPGRTVLVLSPLRVVEVWRNQFRLHAQNPYEFLALDDRAGTVAEKMRAAREMLAWANDRLKRVVVAINYDSARTEPFASWAMHNAWSLTIADESHRVKAPGGRTSRWVAKIGLRSHFRLALTGTPMPHEPTDIWAQFRFLDPYHLPPSFSLFRSRYALMGGYCNKQVIGWRDLDDLERRFRQLAFRVDDSVLDLPPELDETLSCDLSDAGAKIYRQMERDMLAWLSETEYVTAANAMVRLLRLQQITGGSLPDSLNELKPVDTSKESLLREFLSDLGGEPVVVFAKFAPDLAAIHRAAAANGLRSGELSGNRDDLKAWQEGGDAAPSVLAVQIQAGGVGIDLTRARIGIYYSHGFSLADYVQSRARIRRPPQSRPVAFYHLQVRNSVDEYVLQAVLDRRDLIEATLAGLRHRKAA